MYRYGEKCEYAALDKLVNLPIMDTMDEKEIYNLFLEYVRRFPTAKDAAETLGYTESYISLILSGKRPVTDNIALKLGYNIFKRYEAKR